MSGISKVMTVTSTYDHRIIQGAESGLFLSRMEELLKGEDGFYERIFDDLKLPHRVNWRSTPARAASSSTPTACGATSSPTSTPWTIMAVSSAIGLAELILATVAGAWVYKPAG